MEELIIKERETREKIVTLVNEAGLPAFALKSIFKDFLEQIKLLEEQQYTQAKNSTEKKEETK